MPEDERRRYRLLRGAYAVYGAAGQNESRIDTISGEHLNFYTKNPGKLISLIANIKPYQSGSGIPSPDNIRPITGWTGINITRMGNDSNLDVYSISFGSAGMVYSGILDVTNGILTVDSAFVPLGNLFWDYQSTWRRFRCTDLVNVIKRPPTLNTPTEIMSDRYESSTVKDQDNAIAIATTGNVFIYDHAFTDATRFSMARAEAQIVYPLATPVVYNLTPTDIQTLYGVNNIYMDASGTLTAQYRS